MRTHKITAAATLAIMAASALLTLGACNNGQLPFVKRDVFEEAQNRNKELNITLQNIQESYARQNKELSSILQEISTISRKTSSLQLNVENGAVEKTQAELIGENIEALKDRIDRLENEAKRARKLDKNLAIAASTIKELKQTIANQEIELNILKNTIEDQKVTIKDQADTIAGQSNTIAKQKKELEKTLHKQTEMLYEAGLEFEEIADNGDFKINGQRNKQNIKDYRAAIYEKALTFLTLAAEYGHPLAAEEVEQVKAKREALY